MAYSVGLQALLCVRVTFEIGHEASIRTKRTPEGFTHDWEVFVRGADNTDINHFVEKVVFHLHDTFLKPKRVVKEPPYSVKESGYAGFKLPIDIYFRNQDEPKKVRFNYDLNLQPSGPAISNVIREKYVFRNPDEDLRRRLIRGGGVGVVGSESAGHTTPSDKPNISSSSSDARDDSSAAKPSLPSSGGKSKPSGEPSKKHKTKEHRPEEPRVSNPFHELFGPPIKTNKVSPDPKKTSQPSPKVSPISKSSKPPDKTGSEKVSSSSKSSKHSGQKDSREGSDRSSSSSKDEKKERSKDREKHKEKPPKRPSSPPKGQPSPPKLQPTTQTPKPPKEEGKKHSQDESKGKNDSKPVSEANKTEKEKKKKEKKNRDEKSKKDKHKEHESKSSDKMERSEKSLKESKEKESTRKQEKEGNKEIEKPKEKEKSVIDGDKEHGRHKHKKKEKSKREDSNKEKDKSSKKDKTSTSSEGKKSGETKDRDRNGVVSETVKKHSLSPSLSPSPPELPHEKSTPSPEKLPSQQSSKDKPKRPLTTLLAELTGHDSSDSNLSPPSPDDDSLDLPIPLLTKSTPPAEISAVKQEQITKPASTSEPLNNINSNSHINDKLESGKSKSDSVNQERISLNKDSGSKQKDKSTSKRSKEKKESSSGTKDEGVKTEKESSKKRKRKSSSKAKEEPELGAPTKAAKLDHEQQARPNSRDANEVAVQNEVAPMEIPKEEEPPAAATRDVAPVACEPEAPSASVPAPPASPPTLFSPDYVSQLKDLQRKIMTLEDNAELQRVVQVIAETGQYEITKKTFDFDLCALDRSTVKRLQDFFTTS